MTFGEIRHLAGKRWAFSLPREHGATVSLSLASFTALVLQRHLLRCFLRCRIAGFYVSADALGHAFVHGLFPAASCGFAYLFGFALLPGGTAFCPLGSLLWSWFEFIWSGSTGSQQFVVA